MPSVLDTPIESPAAAPDVPPAPMPAGPAPDSKRGRERPRRVGRRRDERKDRDKKPKSIIALIHDGHRFETERWQPDTREEFRRLAANTPNLLDATAAPDVAPIDVLPWIVAIWHAVFGFVAAQLVRRQAFTPAQGAAFTPTAEEHARLSKQTATTVDFYFGTHLQHLPPWAGLLLTAGAIATSAAQRAMAVPATNDRQAA
jgi:hypothetical protein